MHNQANINPATGLLMASDSVCGLDVGGNPYEYHNPWSFSNQPINWEC